MKTIVFLGDSLTYGYGTYPDCAYPSVVETKLHIKAINKGENGDLTCGMSARFRTDVLAYHPDTVMILGGTNDILNGVSLQSTINSIDEMVQSARNANINVMIGLPMEPDSQQLTDYGLTSSMIHRIMNHFASYHTQLLDYCQQHNILVVDFYENYPKHLFIDGIHPTAKGYEIMANIFINAMNSLDI